MGTDYNYDKLQPFDVVCTAASSLLGRMIRLYTAHLKSKNGLKEFTRMQIANHCAIIVKMDNRYWLAEMVADGLKVNSMRIYLDNTKEKIVAIKRLIGSPDIAAINAKVLDLCQQTRGYDFNMVLQYLRVGRNDSGKYYCSELCEVMANMFGFTWDCFQLKRADAKKRLIAPVEIQLGHAESSNFVTDFYIR